MGGLISREKRLWFWSLLVGITIFLTLFLGEPFQHYLRDQNVQVVFFLLGMLLVGTAIFVHGIQIKPGRFELATLIGVMGVYVMFFFRLGAPERSHLIEYSVLAIFIHSALVERYKSKSVNGLLLALGAFTITLLIGILDEVIQIFLPTRVFDTQDILFNGLVSFFAIVTSLFLNWTRKRLMARKTR